MRVYRRDATTGTFRQREEHAGEVAEGYQFAVITAPLMNNGEGGHAKERKRKRGPIPGAAERDREIGAPVTSISDDDRAGSRRALATRVGGSRQVDPPDETHIALGL